MNIDLRSDTVTRPTEAMRRAMMSAEVGDDVFAEDPTTRALQELVADMFGMESALYCPSGTMCNQIAIKCHTRPMDEMICDELSHIYLYENGGFALHSGISLRLIKGENGLITPAQIEESILPKQDWLPLTKLVVIENTANKGGGSYYDLSTIKDIAACCKRNNLRLHMDGARLFNAMAEGGYTAKEIGQEVDSLSLCLSKGLGAPVGSLLLGDRSFIAEARRWRKAFGGGMRQSGILAAAGIYALGHHIERLKEDHTHAKLLAAALSESAWVEEILPVSTNIVIFKVVKTISSADFTQALAKKNILAIPFSPTQVRLVTHLDISSEMCFRAIEAIKNVDFP